ncbi:hypothetical protein ABIE89_000231 [Bradyrhizobium niftali]|uniref:hypothetical protein n=1 Tax=Bradyrhizobium niftali TaxID=2560055 RepID=UPI003836280B
MHDLQAGLPVMRQLVRDAINKKSALWMAGAMRQLFHPANDNSHLPQVERFAMGNELSEPILGGKSSARAAPKFLSYPAVAQYYHESGNKDRAIKLIEVTLKSLDGPAPIPIKLQQKVMSLLSKRWPTTRVRRLATDLFVRLQPGVLQRWQSVTAGGEKMKDVTI